MNRKGIYTDYYPFLDEYLSAYMRKELTLHDATVKIIEGIENKKK